MREARVNPLMRSFRRDRQGLAEIVGTLMLVVIVVAAATAFSFFVAAYQKQLQSEETLTHDRALESVKILGVSELLCSALSTCATSCGSSYCFAEISFLVASIDVNPISLTSVFLDYLPIDNFSAKIAGATYSPCYNATDVLNSTFGVGTCSPINIPAYATATLVFDLDNEIGCVPGNAAPCGVYSLGGTYTTITSISDITLQALTGLGNEFTETFAPPDAVATVSFLSEGSASVPEFDGLNSYQPTSANNASILWYNWTIDPTSACSPYSGPQFECASLTAGDTYTVMLEVTNTDGLSGFTSISFTQPT